jgi:hypothetical protein
VEVKRHPENGTLSFAVGVETGHPAAGKEVTEVPFIAPQARMSTESRDGKWWFVFNYDQPGDGHPGKQHNIERYRSMLDVQHHATHVAHQLHRFAGQAPRIGGSASLPVAVVQAREIDRKTTEIPAHIREKEDALGVGDEELRRAAGNSISGPIGEPAPPSNELAADTAPGASEVLGGDESAETGGVAENDDASPEGGSTGRRRKRH